VIVGKALQCFSTETVYIGLMSNPQRGTAGGGFIFAASGVLLST
jgi:hypothetical protein